MNWTTPQYAEVKMDAEIGSYQEDPEPSHVPDFVASRPAGYAGRRPVTMVRPARAPAARHEADAGSAVQ